MPIPERDDPHVLDRRVGEQPLVVGLAQREEAGEHERRRAEHQQQHVHVGRSDRELGDRAEPQHRVQRRGQQRAGQHRADRAGTLRVSVRQPRVHRHEPHLRAESDQHEREPGAHQRLGSDVAPRRPASSTSACSGRPGSGRRPRRSTRSRADPRASPADPITMYFQPASTDCSDPSLVTSSALTTVVSSTATHITPRLATIGVASSARPNRFSSGQ